MYRKITDGFYWLQECPTNNKEFVDQVNPPKWYKGNEDVHIPQSVYLLVDEYSLLFDTFSPASTDEVLNDVKEILGERDLDYLVLSHTDVPHAGNTKAILDTYPEAQLIAPKYGTGHELYRLSSSRLVGNGDKLELGKFKINFHEAPFVDSAIHLWMTEDTTNTLFTVDWHGFPHNGSDCMLFADELDHPISEDQLMQFHGRVMFWLEYVKPEKVNQEIDHILAEHSPEQVAPAHGHFIRQDAAAELEKMKSVVELISEDGRIGAFG